MRQSSACLFCLSPFVTGGQSAAPIALNCVVRTVQHSKIQMLLQPFAFATVYTFAHFTSLLFNYGQGFSAIPQFVTPI